MNWKTKLQPNKINSQYVSRQMTTQSINLGHEWLRSGLKVTQTSNQFKHIFFIFHSRIYLFVVWLLRILIIIKKIYKYMFPFETEFVSFLFEFDFEKYFLGILTDNLWNYNWHIQYYNIQLCFKLKTVQAYKLTTSYRRIV